jgi:hypothetical protein
MTETPDMTIPEIHRHDVAEHIGTETSSRLTITVDFEGHGIGKLLVRLLVRRQAQKEMPANVANLKRHLESPQSQSRE